MAVRTTQSVVLPRVSDFFPGLRIGDKIPKVFIRQRTATVLDGTNFPAGYILAQSAIVPEGFTGKVEDFNVNFTTAGTAVLGVVVLDANGNTVGTLLDNVAVSQSGIGSTVFPGQAIGVSVITAGTGTLRSIDFSGDHIFIGNDSP